MTGDRLLTIDELAEWLNVAPATVRDWRTRRPGFLPVAVKLGGQVRYRRSDVEAWLEARREHPVMRFAADRWAG